MNYENKLSRNFGDIMANTYLTKWFNDAQYALKISEVKEGSYDYRFVDSNIGGGKINEGDNFRFRFQAGRFEAISLENSYIELKQKLRIIVPPHAKTGYIKKYSVGYINSAGIFGQYIIRSTDTKPLYQSNNAHYEWFLDSCSVTDEAIRNDETYSNLEKVRSMKPGPHEFIDISTVAAGTAIEAELHLKILLMRFITFRSVKYLLDWMGPFEFELYPSYEGVLLAPVIPQELFTIYPGL